MSGYIRGKIECYISNKDFNYNGQNAFKNIFDFFTTHPQYTLMALNSGSTSGPASAGAGNGWNYADTVGQAGTPAVGSFGNNAWFVVRANATAVRPFDVYHAFHWTGGVNGTRGEALSNTALAASRAIFNGATNAGFGTNNVGGIAYQCAIGISGSSVTSTSSSLGGNPWKGTMNAFTGSFYEDQKAASGSHWSAPIGGGTGVMIFPRSNDGPNGTNQAASSVNNSQCHNYGIILQAAITDLRMHIIADDDSWVLIYDPADTGAAVYASFSGLYVPRNGQPTTYSTTQSSIIPYVTIMAGPTTLPWSTANATSNPTTAQYGDAAGTNVTQGGIVGNTTASVRTLIMDQFNAFQNNVNFQPCVQISSSYGGGGGMSGSMGFAGGGFFDEFQIPVGVYETSPTQITGYLGEIDFVRYVYIVQTPGVRWDFNRAWFGTTTIAALKLSVPWDSQNRTVPRTGVTRQGISFIRPGPA